MRRVVFQNHGNFCSYDYLANSNLVDQLKMGANQYLVERVWDAQRNLLTSIDTGWDTVEGYDSKAKYEYRYDDLGRRTDVAQTGSIFDRYGSGLVRRFGYNDRGELTSESSEIGSDPVLTGAMVPGRGYGYGFDSAGNRTSASVDGLGPNGYTPDGLNQYDSRSVPGKIHVSGFASPSANVIARVEPNAPVAATRAGASDYFHAAVDSVNTLSANYDTVETTAAIPGTPDVYSQDTKQEFVAKTPEVYTHDDDGNLTSDGLWRYEYDAENRLVKMIMRSTGEGRPSTLTPRKRLEFTYDYVGRRVEKKVYTGMDEVSDTSGIVAAGDHLKFVYDGFNLIAEMDGSAGVLRSFVWGLDESGTTQGAGGVGGLLMIIDGASKYLTAYDGSGNLTALIDEADGSVAAAYEYGPFGEPLRSSGDYADVNPFRFSTKYTDSETGLVYFGLRYYNTTTGRFINRDPIGEAGGLNLYGFVGNDPINRIDFLGLSHIDGHVDNDEEEFDDIGRDARNRIHRERELRLSGIDITTLGDEADLLEARAELRLEEAYLESLADNPNTLNVTVVEQGVNVNEDDREISENYGYDRRITKPEQYIDTDIYGIQAANKAARKYLSGSNGLYEFGTVVYFYRDPSNPDRKIYGHIEIFRGERPSHITRQQFDAKFNEFATKQLKEKGILLFAVAYAHAHPFDAQDGLYFTSSGRRGGSADDRGKGDVGAANLSGLPVYTARGPGYVERVNPTGSEIYKTQGEVIVIQADNPPILSP